MKNIPVTSGKVEKRKTGVLRTELATMVCLVGYGGRLGWLRGEWSRRRAGKQKMKIIRKKVLKNLVVSKNIRNFATKLQN